MILCVGLGITKPPFLPLLCEGLGESPLVWDSRWLLSPVSARELPSRIYRVLSSSSPDEQATSIHGTFRALGAECGAITVLASTAQPVPRPESCARPQSWEWSLWGRGGSPKEIGVQLSEVGMDAGPPRPADGHPVSPGDPSYT